MVAFIRHIPPSEARGRLAHVYREIRSDVPRVPNLMQVFSLRPETMTGIYRSWLSSMWNGRVPRRSKELLAVAVSKAAACDYCVDAHLVYLQATGMDAAKTYEIEQRMAEASSLTPAERVAVGFAARITSDPRSVAPEHLAALAEAWPDTEERVEILTVMSALNTITRICNGLGVTLEIPFAVRRFNAGRKGAIALMSRLTALGLDFSAKAVPVRAPEENRHAGESLYLGQLGFPALPPGFEQMEFSPELLDGQLRLMEKAVAVVPRDRWMRIGLVVSRLVGCSYFADNCAQWLAQGGAEPDAVVAASEGAATSLPEAERACLRFVRDLTLHSHTIGEERIKELRMVGLSDGAILDVAFVGGLFNGVARLIATVGGFGQGS